MMPLLKPYPPSKGKGCRVVVVAGPNASSALKAAGHHFIPVGSKASAAAKVAPVKAATQNATPKSVPKRKAKQELEPFLLETLGKAFRAGVLMVALNGLVAVGTRISSLPKKTWRAYLTAPARSGRYECDKKGPDARVRLASLPTR